MEGRVNAHYAQIGLWDNEDKNSYPQFPQDPNSCILGEKGVVVLLDQEKEILTVVELKDPNPNTHYFKLCEGKISIGSKGISFGNIPAATTYSMFVPSGDYKIKAYSDSIDFTAVSKIYFSLEKV